jgi:hypothetical protein
LEEPDEAADPQESNGAKPDLPNNAPEKSEPEQPEQK